MYVSIWNVSVCVCVCVFYIYIYIYIWVYLHVPVFVFIFELMKIIYTSVHFNVFNPILFLSLWSLHYIYPEFGCSTCCLCIHGTFHHSVILTLLHSVYTRLFSTATNETFSWVDFNYKGFKESICFNRIILYVSLKHGWCQMNCLVYIYVLDFILCYSVLILMCLQNLPWRMLMVYTLVNYMAVCPQYLGLGICNVCMPYYDKSRCTRSNDFIDTTAVLQSLIDCYNISHPALLIYLYFQSHKVTKWSKLSQDWSIIFNHKESWEVCCWCWLWKWCSWPTQWKGTWLLFEVRAGVKW